MKRIFAVALVDFRRLAFGLVSTGLVAGLVPAFSSGLGSRLPVEAALSVVFILVGLGSGGYFGNDFAQGRSSFFFARPLPTPFLIAGRFLGLMAVAVAAFVGFMAAYWISSRGRDPWDADVLNRYHALALGASWSMALFVSLAIAAQGSRRPSSPRRFRDFVMIFVRLVFGLLSGILLFGFLADVLLRAYSSRTPLNLLITSWFVAAFVASCVAIAAGRVDSSTISRVQNKTMVGHFVLTFVVILAAWAYVLHPGPGAIVRVNFDTMASPGGQIAYVRTTVNRGDPKHFNPVFVLDIASGQTRRLNSDPWLGPWTSADGGTVVWSEATPFFFRPLWRALGGASSFRVRTSGGEVEALPMPSRMPEMFSGMEPMLGWGSVDRVMPASDGDVFAIFWDRHLTFTSRSRGELSDVKFTPARPFFSGAAFLPSGQLRAALTRGSLTRGYTNDRTFEITDFDPRSGTSTPRATFEFHGAPRIQFDAQAQRVLLTFATEAGQSSVSLIEFGDDPGANRSIPIVVNGVNPSAIFLADGRVAVAAGGEHRTFRILSATGQVLKEVPLGEGFAPFLYGEIFPGVLATRMTRFGEELSLVDAATGEVLRHLPEFYSRPAEFSSPPPPGTPAARLIQSRDGKVYELPSLTAQPRLLLPLP